MPVLKLLWCTLLVSSIEMAPVCRANDNQTSSAQTTFTLGQVIVIIVITILLTIIATLGGLYLAVTYSNCLKPSPDKKKKKVADGDEDADEDDDSPKDAKKRADKKRPKSNGQAKQGDASPTKQRPRESTSSTGSGSTTGSKIFHSPSSTSKKDGKEKTKNKRKLPLSSLPDSSKNTNERSRAKAPNPRSVGASRRGGQSSTESSTQSQTERQRRRSLRYAAKQNGVQPLPDNIQVEYDSNEIKDFDEAENDTDTETFQMPPELAKDGKEQSLSAESTKINGSSQDNGNLPAPAPKEHKGSPVDRFIEQQKNPKVWQPLNNYDKNGPKEPKDKPPPNGKRS